MSVLMIDYNSITSISYGPISIRKLIIISLLSHEGLHYHLG